jgi:hypothetical protein
MVDSKSELHITGIERHNKGAWVAIARLRGMTLAEWAIEALNKAAHDKSVDLDGKERGRYD